ncbi:hypothetical protein DFR26_0096 [Paraperlucidibaca baekdonensis]|uniref:Type VI secretion system (T6SS) amidase immunity protein Tai4 n=1 Tax=Paraperlucidibaca baekdonensis TaxID=748120 RepID=A0A3E0H9N6_9GAMM|nr:hypothetical protein [Paraperlucidibaca baekdonensis]REH39902.1 hypothetical protein DFR26_0096 [Paraperlucidibaca baekdonensis]
MAHTNMTGRAWLLALCAVSSSSALAVDFAAAREQQFKQACMTDATVAAGQREALCRCVFEAFAYGGDTRFGITDVLALDARVWEAPDQRLPKSALGDNVRSIRQACVRESAR